MRFINNKKTVALALTVLTVLSCGAGIAYAAGNAADAAPVTPVYSNEELNDPITAGELARINGRILGIGDADAPYSGDGKRELTRAEAVAIIARTFRIEPLENAENTFADNESIPAEYRGYVNAMKAAGYVDGDKDNVFAPDFIYTKADALEVINHMISGVADKNVRNINVPENYVIRKAGVQLKDAVIAGNLIIGNGVGDGEVTLENVTVGGRLIVFGGGSNSIVVRGKSTIPFVDVCKTIGQAARVKVEGEAVVKMVTVAENSKAIINGAITNLFVEGNTSVELQNATVVNVEVRGSSVTLNADGKSIVQSVTIDASNVDLTGTGKVESVVVTGNAKSGVVVDTKGTKIDVAEGAGNVTDSSGKPVVESGQTGTTTGSSNTNPSGGSDSSGGGDDLPTVDPTPDTPPTPSGSGVNDYVVGNN